jgi:hypothetical protein
MSKNNLTEAFNLIERNKDKSDFEALDDDVLIIQFEKKLGVTFPPSYRSFLLNYGCGGVGSSEIYGIIKNNPDGFGVPNGIWLTLDEREKWNLPHHFIIIGDTGDGDWYALDSSQPNSEGEYPVVICCYDGDTYHTEKIHEDFGEFLLTETQFALKEDEDDEEE